MSEPAQLGTSVSVIIAHIPLMQRHSPCDASVIVLQQWPFIGLVQLVDTTPPSGVGRALQVQTMFCVKQVPSFAQ
jgi:hypothetical protein